MSKESSIQMVQPLNLEEIETVIMACPNNKSPGFDGLSYEFYKVTWHIIKDAFLEVIQCQLDRKKLINSNTVGAVRLLSKVNGVPKVDELRPISLLNCDYKILSKIFVQRIKPVLPDIICSSQLCTVGKRNILFGVQNVLSTICYVNEKNLAACLLSLDFFKAYDRVMISFLLAVMKKMGFDELFCEWIQMLHSNAKAKFLLTKISRAIRLSFSIRQGDPLAMILYMSYVEPLIIMLQRSVQGLRILNFRQDIEAFCDDLNLITDSIQDLQTVDSVVSKCEKISGAILYRNNKCKVIGFGKWKNRVNWPLAYVKSVTEIKIFGEIIENSIRSIIKKNWQHRLSKFEAILVSWSSRFLETLSQRISVVKMSAFSRVYYIAAVQHERSLTKL